MDHRKYHYSPSLTLAIFLVFMDRHNYRILSMIVTQFDSCHLLGVHSWIVVTTKSSVFTQFDCCHLLGVHIPLIVVTAPSSLLTQLESHHLTSMFCPWIPVTPTSFISILVNGLKVLIANIKISGCKPRQEEQNSLQNTMSSSALTCLEGCAHSLGSTLLSSFLTSFVVTLPTIRQPSLATWAYLMFWSFPPVHAACSHVPKGPAFFPLPTCHDVFRLRWNFITPQTRLSFVTPCSFRGGNVYVSHGAGKDGVFTRDFFNYISTAPRGEKSRAQLFALT
jgi:hypothetical protein